MPFPVSINFVKIFVNQIRFRYTIHPKAFNFGGGLMEHSVVAKKLSESLKDIFAFSASRLYHKQDAEDLTNDIIVEVLSSSDRLENDEAFYAYMWKIADHTLKRYIRNQKKAPILLPEDFSGAYWDVPEEGLIASEELTALRRELSLLSKQYRDVTIQFYVENKSCAFISKELGISEEMVKYYLFKTRKILKEGVTMTRQYGEKSYNPSKFGINFWGCGGQSYLWDTFERKLPGNIVLAAYEKPMSIQELSLELGVSVPYLEDEIEILTRHHFIQPIGNKYQTDCCDLPSVIAPIRSGISGKSALSRNLHRNRCQHF